MGPLATGALAGIAGLGGALWVGAPLLAAFAAYSLCGALGVIGGGVLMMLQQDDPSPAPVRAGSRGAASSIG